MSIQQQRKSKALSISSMSEINGEAKLSTTSRRSSTRSSEEPCKCRYCYRETKSPPPINIEIEATLEDYKKKRDSWKLFYNAFVTYVWATKAKKSLPFVCQCCKKIHAELYKRVITHVLKGGEIPSGKFVRQNQNGYEDNEANRNNAGKKKILACLFCQCTTVTCPVQKREIDVDAIRENARYVSQTLTCTTERCRRTEAGLVDRNNKLGMVTYNRNTLWDSLENRGINLDDYHLQYLMDDSSLSVSDVKCNASDKMGGKNKCATEKDISDELLALEEPLKEEDKPPPNMYLIGIRESMSKKHSVPDIRWEAKREGEEMFRDDDIPIRWRGLLTDDPLYGKDPSLCEACYKRVTMDKLTFIFRRSKKKLCTDDGHKLQCTCDLDQFDVLQAEIMEQDECDGEIDRMKKEEFKTLMNNAVSSWSVYVRNCMRTGMKMLAPNTENALEELARFLYKEGRRRHLITPSISLSTISSPSKASSSDTDILCKIGLIASKLYKRFPPCDVMLQELESKNKSGDETLEVQGGPTAKIKGYAQELRVRMQPQKVGKTKKGGKKLIFCENHEKEEMVAKIQVEVENLTKAYNKGADEVASKDSGENKTQCEGQDSLVDTSSDEENVNRLEQLVTSLERRKAKQDGEEEPKEICKCHLPPREATSEENCRMWINIWYERDMRDMLENHEEILVEFDFEDMDSKYELPPQRTESMDIERSYRMLRSEIKADSEITSAKKAKSEETTRDKQDAAKGKGKKGKGEEAQKRGIMRRHKKKMRKVRKVPPVEDLMDHSLNYRQLMGYLHSRKNVSFKDILRIYKYPVARIPAAKWELRGKVLDRLQKNIVTINKDDGRMLQIFVLPKETWQGKVLKKPFVSFGILKRKIMPHRTVYPKWIKPTNLTKHDEADLIRDSIIKQLYVSKVNKKRVEEKEEQRRKKKEKVAAKRQDKKQSPKNRRDFCKKKKRRRSDKRPVPEDEEEEVKERKKRKKYVVRYLRLTGDKLLKRKFLIQRISVDAHRKLLVLDLKRAEKHSMDMVRYYIPFIMTTRKLREVTDHRFHIVYSLRNNILKQIKLRFRLPRVKVFIKKISEIMLALIRDARGYTVKPEDFEKFLNKKYELYNYNFRQKVFKKPTFEKMARSALETLLYWLLFKLKLYGMFDLLRSKRFHDIVRPLTGEENQDPNMSPYLKKLYKIKADIKNQMILSVEKYKQETKMAKMKLMESTESKLMDETNSACEQNIEPSNYQELKAEREAFELFDTMIELVKILYRKTPLTKSMIKEFTLPEQIKPKKIIKIEKKKTGETIMESEEEKREEEVEEEVVEGEEQIEKKEEEEEEQQVQQVAVSMTAPPTTPPKLSMRQPSDVSITEHRSRQRSFKLKRWMPYEFELCVSRNMAMLTMEGLIEFMKSCEGVEEEPAKKVKKKQEEEEAPAPELPHVIPGLLGITMEGWLEAGKSPKHEREERKKKRGLKERGYARMKMESIRKMDWPVFQTVDKTAFRQQLVKKLYNLPDPMDFAIIPNPKLSELKKIDSPVRKFGKPKVMIMPSKKPNVTVIRDTNSEPTVITKGELSVPKSKNRAKMRELCTPLLLKLNTKTISKLLKKISSNNLVKSKLIQFVSSVRYGKKLEPSYSEPALRKKSVTADLKESGECLQPGMLRPRTANESATLEMNVTAAKLIDLIQQDLEDSLAVTILSRRSRKLTSAPVSSEHLLPNIKRISVENFANPIINKNFKILSAIPGMMKTATRRTSHSKTRNRSKIRTKGTTSPRGKQRGKELGKAAKRTKKHQALHLNTPEYLQDDFTTATAPRNKMESVEIQKRMKMAVNHLESEITFEEKCTRDKETSILRPSKFNPNTKIPKQSNTSFTQPNYNSVIQGTIKYLKGNPRFKLFPFNEEEHWSGRKQAKSNEENIRKMNQKINNIEKRQNTRQKFRVNRQPSPNRKSLMDIDAALKDVEKLQRVFKCKNVS